MCLLLEFSSFTTYTSFICAGFERRRQHQQVLRRSYVVGAGQAGRGVELPHVIEEEEEKTASILFHPNTSIPESPGGKTQHRYCLIPASSVEI